MEISEETRQKADDITRVALTSIFEQCGENRRLLWLVMGRICVGTYKYIMEHIGIAPALELLSQMTEISREAAEEEGIKISKGPH